MSCGFQATLAAAAIGFMVGAGCVALVIAIVEIYARHCERQDEPLDDAR